VCSVKAATGELAAARATRRDQSATREACSRSSAAGSQAQSCRASRRTRVGLRAGASQGSNCKAQRDPSSQAPQRDRDDVTLHHPEILGASRYWRVSTRVEFCFRVSAREQHPRYRRYQRSSPERGASSRTRLHERHLFARPSPDGQIVAYATKYFLATDRMRGLAPFFCSRSAQAFGGTGIAYVLGYVETHAVLAPWMALWAGDPGPGGATTAPHL